MSEAELNSWTFAGICELLVGVGMSPRTHTLELGPGTLLQIVTKKRAGSDKINFKTKKKKIIIGNKIGYFIMIQAWVHWEDITVLSVYAPNNWAPKYMKQKTDNWREKEAIQQQ